ncbi:MAG: ribosome biogenesis GTP-binding protein YihA/YsxC [Candidatus Deferrimicrobiaceae bacterium]
MPSAPRFLLFDPVGNAWPTVRLPQVAFAGRSNVGKSSLLNALVGHSRLARVSNTPGRTRGIALFEVEGRFAFADLPGYGFAKVSRSEREAWKGLVEGYLETCGFLRRVYVLVDVRRGPEEEERQLSAFLAVRGVPYRWVGTKGDKLSAREKVAAAARFDGEPWLAGGGPVLLTSARTKAGIDLLWRDVRAVFSA